MSCGDFFSKKQLAALAHNFKLLNITSYKWYSTVIFMQRRSKSLFLLGVVLLGFIMQFARALAMHNSARSLNRSVLSRRASKHMNMKGGLSSEVVHAKYEKIMSTKITEYGVEAILYRHRKSGASVLSVIAPQDENKVFGITFRTPPSDSTGIPHILEHSVLCGSRKYPVKEPFVDLMRGSLQTFLNAFTYETVNFFH